MGEDQVLPFFLKTWLSEGVEIQLNTFWEKFQSQKQSSEGLYHHLTQCCSPPYFRPSMCSFCLTPTLSLSNFSSCLQEC